MQLRLENIGKKYYQRWLFRNINRELTLGSRVALVGANGSGKSTLLRILAGQLDPSEGRMAFEREGKSISPEKRYRYLSWSGPYVELYQDLTLTEHINLHFRFKDCLLKDPAELAEVLELLPHRDKKLRFYSSGMLQRVKVGLALFSRTDLLLLDEPTANMDTHNAQRMLEMIHQHLGDRIYVLASNMEREYEGIEEVLRLGGGL